MFQRKYLICIIWSHPNPQVSFEDFENMRFIPKLSQVRMMGIPPGVNGLKSGLTLLYGELSFNAVCQLYLIPALAACSVKCGLILAAWKGGL